MTIRRLGELKSLPPKVFLEHLSTPPQQMTKLRGQEYVSCDEPPFFLENELPVFSIPLTNGGIIEIYTKEKARNPGDPVPCCRIARPLRRTGEGEWNLGETLT